MKSIPIFQVLLNTITIPQQLLYSEYYFVVTIGEYRLISDILVAINHLNIINQTFELRPRNFKESNLTIEIWDYNQLTVNDEKSVIGQISVDISKFLVNQKMNVCQRMNSMQQMDVPIILDFNITFEKEIYMQPLVSDSKISQNREMQRIVHLIKVEKEYNIQQKQRQESSPAKKDFFFASRKKSPTEEKTNNISKNSFQLLGELTPLEEPKNIYRSRTPDISNKNQGRNQIFQQSRPVSRIFPKAQPSFIAQNQYPQQFYRDMTPTKNREQQKPLPLQIQSQIKYRQLSQTSYHIKLI